MEDASGAPCALRITRVDNERKSCNTTLVSFSLLAPRSAGAEAEAEVEEGCATWLVLAESADAVPLAAGQRIEWRWPLEAAAAAAVARCPISSAAPVRACLAFVGGDEGDRRLFSGAQPRAAWWGVGEHSLLPIVFAAPEGAHPSGLAGPEDAPALHVEAELLYSADAAAPAISSELLPKAPTPPPPPVRSPAPVAAPEATRQQRPSPPRRRPPAPPEDAFTQRRNKANEARLRQIFERQARSDELEEAIHMRQQVTRHNREEHLHRRVLERRARNIRSLQAARQRRQEDVRAALAHVGAVEVHIRESLKEAEVRRQQRAREREGRDDSSGSSGIDDGDHPSSSHRRSTRGEESERHAHSRRHTGPPLELPPLTVPARYNAPRTFRPAPMTVHAIATPRGRSNPLIPPPGTVQRVARDDPDVALTHLHTTTAARRALEFLDQRRDS